MLSNRRALVEAAWAAGRAKRSDLGAQYRRLAARRGKKRALLAVGHSLLVISYQMLRSGVEYRDLGGEYLDHLEPERLRRYLARRLQRLGYRVTLTTTPAPLRRGIPQASGAGLRARRVLAPLPEQTLNARIQLD